MEIVFKKEEKDQVSQKISCFFNSKPVFSNFFLKDLSEIEVFYTQATMFLRKSFGSFYRLYLLTTNPNEAKSLLLNLNGSYAINIPTKGEITDWSDLLSGCGFSLLGTYERYFNPVGYKRDDFSAKFADKKHFDQIKSLMYGYFNPITDWLPDDLKLTEMIENNQVLINEKNDFVAGFFIYTFEGKKCYFNAWYDNSGDGLYLLYNVYAHMNNNNINYSYFWVNSDNVYVKKIHMLFGAKPDGLRDFTYINTPI